MARGIWDSDFEGDELGDEDALQPALRINHLAYQPAPPAAPASQRPPSLDDDDARALAKPFVGVCVNASGSSGKIASLCPFKAQISFKGKLYYLGPYQRVESAARAYDAVARLIPGRRLNYGAEQSGAGQAAVVAARGAASEAHVLAVIAATRAGSDASGQLTDRLPRWWTG